MASVPLGSSTRNGTSEETVMHLTVLTLSRPCYGSARNHVVFVSYDLILVPQSDSPDPEACRSDREINLHDYHYNLTCLIYFTLSTFNGVRKCGSAISQCWYQLPLVRGGHCSSTDRPACISPFLPELAVEQRSSQQTPLALAVSW